MSYILWVRLGLDGLAIAAATLTGSRFREGGSDDARTDMAKFFENQALKLTKDIRRRDIPSYCYCHLYAGRSYGKGRTCYYCICRRH